MSQFIISLSVCLFFFTEMGGCLDEDAGDDDVGRDGD